MTTTDRHDARKIGRARHRVVLRRLDVLRVVDLSPSMRRVTLTGTELDGFASPGFDDHVKMFFAGPGQDRPILPAVGPDGLEFPESGPLPLGRDLTPRRHDPAPRSGGGGVRRRSRPAARGACEPLGGGGEAR